jgi:hypothetical protein
MGAAGNTGVAGTSQPRPYFKEVRMVKATRLTALYVKSAKLKAGMHSDGGGLYLSAEKRVPLLDVPLP